jgi:hypothetical protein
MYPAAADSARTCWFGDIIGLEAGVAPSPLRERREILLFSFSRRSRGGLV